MKKEEILKLTEDTTRQLMELMNVDAKVSFESQETENGDVSVEINFTGDELGYMIGARGSHLRALQYVISLLVNRNIRQDEGDDTKVFVHVDVGGYNAEHEEKIEQKALRAADDARILGEAVDMEPMNPSDRRVVHMVLEEFDDITTESYGEGRDRFVRVIPA